MEAASVDELPSGGGWQYEPKYDGFRCLAHRQGSHTHLQSKNQKPLERYFPEVAAGLASLPETNFVLDGELVISGGSFEALQLRLHPAESRIRKLSQATPAQLVAFDILMLDGAFLLQRPLAERREALVSLLCDEDTPPALRLGEATESESVARGWLGREGLDGIVAKRLDQRYLPGERAMQKFKLWKTVDCVVGGLYRKSGSQAVEHLLLGLYDADDRLNYVGRTRLQGHWQPLLARPAALAAGSASGEPRASDQRLEQPPDLVVEVSADHITSICGMGRGCYDGEPTKRPESCTMDQIAR